MLIIVTLLVLALLPYLVYLLIRSIRRQKLYKTNSELRAKDAKQVVITMLIGFVLVLVLLFGIEDNSKPAKAEAPAVVQERNTYIESNPPVSHGTNSYQRFIYKFIDLKYGGECLPVKHAIKYRLNDPSSYQHVETTLKLIEKDSTVRVTTTFRAKNGFGALVLTQYRAVVDTNGEILSLKQVE